MNERMKRRSDDDPSNSPSVRKSLSGRNSLSGPKSASTGSNPAGLTVLVVDNYDSFVYNLVQYVGSIVCPPEKAGPGEVLVYRNDDLTLTAVDAIDPDAIIVSPGPGTPAEAGISSALFAERDYPTLGVCLGHQALCAGAGAEVTHAPAVVHGKPSTITHDGTGIFAGLPETLRVGRYHSLAIERGDLPESLVETARTVEQEPIVMAVRDENCPHVGVQFHPESILTHEGIDLIANFLETYVP